MGLSCTDTFLEVGILFDTYIRGSNSIYMYVIPQQVRGVVLGLLHYSMYYIHNDRQQLTEWWPSSTFFNIRIMAVFIPQQRK